ncbi:hypothetical protein M0R45_005835 [Rubus argutus]|uniref:Uncharacterized protein n=1 Tax=Rubus argutus TaxID=59490 RepID=A0AAW1YNX6_RUBAR
MHSSNACRRLTFWDFEDERRLEVLSLELSLQIIPSGKSTEAENEPGESGTGGLSESASSSTRARGIRVKVLNENLKRALTFMQRKTQSSDDKARANPPHQQLGEEKPVLARKLKAILVKKVSYAWIHSHFWILVAINWC